MTARTALTRSIFNGVLGTALLVTAAAAPRLGSAQATDRVATEASSEVEHSDVAVPSPGRPPREAATPIPTGPPALPDDLDGLGLFLWGTAGTMVLYADGDVPRARLWLEGRGVNEPEEVCAVDLSSEQGIPLEPLGRPDGLLRYRLAAPACPIQVDVLPGSVLVREPAVCVFEAADCRADVAGLWAPRDADEPALADPTIDGEAIVVAEAGGVSGPPAGGTSTAADIDACGRFPSRNGRQFCRERFELVSTAAAIAAFARSAAAPIEPGPPAGDAPDEADEPADAPISPRFGFDESELPRITTGPRAIPEDVTGIALSRWSDAGEIVISAEGDDLRASVAFEGRGSSAADEACVVELVGEDGVPLLPLGRPEGLLRYRLAAPACPLELEILPASVLVLEPRTCVFEAADCSVEVEGLWAPRDAGSANNVRRSNVIGMVADLAAADNERALRLRGAPASPRELGPDFCAPFEQPEERLFCEARVATAAAASLAVRLGLFPDAPQAGPVDRTPPPPLDLRPQR